MDYPKRRQDGSVTIPAGYRRPKEPTNENPWIEQHISNEIPFQDSPAIARALVMNEYDPNDPTPKCRCGQNNLFYKATIGCHKCPSCGALAHCYGTEEPEYID